MQTDGWPEQPVDLIKGDGGSARPNEDTRQRQFKLTERTVASTYSYTEVSVIFLSCTGQARVEIQDGAWYAFPSAQWLPRPLGRPRRRWEENIKMDLHEVGGGCGDWMELAQDRDRWRALVSTVRNLRVQKMRGIS